MLAEIKALAEASASLSSLNSSDPSTRNYVQTSRRFFMKRWVESEPGALAFSDGRSVLVTLFGLSVEAALEWWELRGAEAWTPTEADPFPLKSLLSRLMRSSFDPSRMTGPRFQWPPDIDNNSDSTTRSRTQLKTRVAAFLQDGLRHAMPLRADATKVQLSAAEIEAQAVVVGFLSEPCSLFEATEKFPWLQAHGGALAMANRDDYLRLIENPAVTPNTLAWARRDMHPLHRPLADMWATDIQLPHAEHVLPWLEAHGVDTDRERGQVLEKALQNVSEWSQVQTLIDALPGGWERSWRDMAFLPWQGILKHRPKFLDDLVRMPHAAERVALVSPNGHGIWDALALGFTSIKTVNWNGSWATWEGPTQKSVLALANWVPLQLHWNQQTTWPAEGPWGFRLHSFLPPWWASFCEESLSAPGAAVAFFGPPDSKQALRAGALALNLLVKQATNASQRECVATQVKILHTARRAHPQAFAPDIGAVLWFIQALLREGKIGIKQDLSLFMEESFPKPVPDQMGWVEEMRRRIPNPERSHSSLTVFQGLAASARLNAALPFPSAPRPSPRF